MQGSTTVSLEMEPVKLPHVDSLIDFFQQLRLAKFRLDPVQLVSAEQMLLMAHSEEWSVDRFRSVLTMLFGKTLQEQKELNEYFDRWTGIKRAVQYTGASVNVAQKSRLGRRLVIVLSIVITLVMAGWFWRVVANPPATKSETSQQLQTPADSRQFWDVIIGDLLRAGAALPILLFFVWYVREGRRRALWRTARAEEATIDFEEIQIPALLEPIYVNPDMRASARQLRRHRPTESREFDVEHSIYATAGNAGYFTPIWLHRLTRPEYIILIEESSTYDHIARLADLVVEQLRANGVAIQRFYFNTDPRLVFRDDRERTAVRLFALSDRTPDTRLLIFGSGAGFFNSLTDQINGRIRDVLRAWPARVLLSVRPIEAWGGHEAALLDSGFSLGTASVDGIKALADRSTQKPFPSGHILAEARLQPPSTMSTSDTKGQEERKILGKPQLDATKEQTTALNRTDRLSSRPGWGNLMKWIAGREVEGGVSLPQFAFNFTLLNHAASSGLLFISIWVAWYWKLWTAYNLEIFILITSLFALISWVSPQFANNISSRTLTFRSVSEDFDWLHYARSRMAFLLGVLCINCSLLIWATGGLGSPFVPFYITVFLLALNYCRFPQPATGLTLLFVYFFLTSILMSEVSWIHQFVPAPIDEVKQVAINNSYARTVFEAGFIIASMIIPLISLYLAALRTRGDGLPPAAET